MSLEVKRSWNTNISVTSLLDCNEYIRMWRGYSSSRAQFPSPIIAYHAVTMRPFSDAATPSFLNEPGNTASWKGWWVDSAADLTGVLHHSTPGTDTCTPAALEAGVRKWYCCWVETDSYRNWAATVESRTSSWCSSITRSGWVGGCLNTQKTHLSCCIRFPPISAFPFPLMHHFYWFFFIQQRRVICWNEPSGGTAASEERVKPINDRAVISKTRRSGFSRTRDCPTDISHFVWNDA